MIDMGKRLKTLRIEYKYTQKQLAKRVGIAPSAISSYEAGIRYPSYEVLIKLSSIYHVTTDYLLGLNELRPLDISGLNDEEVQAISRLIQLLRIKNNA